MSADRKKLIVLISLVVLWAALFVMQRYPGQDPQPTVSPVVRRSRTRRAAASRPRPQKEKERSEMPRMRLGRIKRERPRYEREARNIFASIERSAFPKPPLKKPKAVPPPPPPPPDPFLIEAKKIKYLGFAKAKGRATAFLGVGKELVVVSETEVFGGRFRVKEVKEETVILSSLDGTKEVQLRLSPGPSTAPPSGGKKRGMLPGRKQRGKRP
ncbi:MAG: hypothetical protein ACE5G5_12410 [Candidatus Methylomirabilales bacterium]